MTSHQQIAGIGEDYESRYGFHNAENALAMIMLVCGPVTLELPYHT